MDGTLNILLILSILGKLVYSHTNIYKYLGFKALSINFKLEKEALPLYIRDTGTKLSSLVYFDGDNLTNPIEITNGNVQNDPRL